MTAPEKIDAFIASVVDWRGEKLALLRKAINDADSRLAEDWKWNTPVWTHKGNVCALGAFKDHVKVNFFKGAHIADPRGLFNAGLEAKDSRAVDLSETDQIDKVALADLVRAAADLNEA